MATFGSTVGADKARDAEWEDLQLERILALTSRSREIGWREALVEVEAARPFFAQRMRNLLIGNWHLLRLLPRSARVLDLGCGFGSLALGLADYFQNVLGMDALRSRVDYASLRASQDDRKTLRFVQGNGLALPVRSGSLDLVTMNGVLEWAGLFGDGSPRDLQLSMLRDVRRALAPTGSVAIAIENRLAMETLAGMADTHTGLRLAPLLPRPVATLMSRVIRRRPMRSRLYDAAGYRRLLRHAGFANVRVLELAPSYNEYDFVVDPAYGATYSLLWKRELVPTFYRRAGTWRQAVAQRWPATLGHFAYAFLVLGGSIATLLDADHPLWERSSRHGVPAGAARFACQATTTASMTLVSHDADKVLGAIEISAHDGYGDPGPPKIAPRITDSLGLQTTPTAGWRDFGLSLRCFLPRENRVSGRSAYLNAGGASRSTTTSPVTVK